MATVTIKDMAKKLGVSPATVSLALNGRHGVNETTRKMVLDLAEKWNYHGTIAKKAPTKQGTINFLIYRRAGRILTNTQFFARLIEAVEKAARQHRYALTITYCDGQAQLADSLAAAAASHCLGVLMLGTEMGQDDIPFLEASPVPVVVLDCNLLGASFDMVSINNMDGVWRAMQYLHDRGVTDIGYLRSSFPIVNFTSRYIGYTYSLQEFGQTLSADKVFELDPTVDGAQRDIETLLASGRKLPEALLADNDLIAIGAIRGLLQAGYRVPEDVSIIGFDNIPLSTYAEPPLTSVEVSCHDLGARAVEVLLWRIAHPEAIAQQVSISTKLVVRSSVREPEKHV
ncbi:LacI family DNA-binding transcriptional regulator [uncultured Mitsuokella sp.]|uniref:LacI family DNA-binding transcriptional regulator n=1 Tax=uncultured Mitsuokella sp. TaxID=453120 RepID=UPI0026DCF228|nr:LacI family DNA-binding transcriptional regulator [uncultured Mitsuokella sp.]